MENTTSLKIKSLSFKYKKIIILFSRMKSGKKKKRINAMTFENSLRFRKKMKIVTKSND